MPKKIMLSSGHVVTTPQRRVKKETAEAVKIDVENLTEPDFKALVLTSLGYQIQTKEETNS